MPDLGTAVKALVDFATKGGKDRELRQAAYDVLQAFDPADVRAMGAGLKALEQGIRRADGKGEQILLLTLGALVEAGASPELAWPTAAYHLRETLVDATTFSSACVDAADEIGIQEAVRIAGPTLQKKMPREHAAWELLRSRCLTAVACLTRSSKVRQQARASKDELIKAAAGLDELVEEVTFFNQAIKLIDDVPLLVMHPATRRGWRVAMNDVTTNLDMFVLLLDALIGDPRKGMLAGARPNPKAVAALTDPEASFKTPPAIKVQWNLVAWTGVQPDLTLPDPHAQAQADWVWLEGVPIDIPLFEGERVVLFQPPVTKKECEVEAVFSALAPRIEVRSKVSAAEVQRLLARMAPLAAKHRAKRAVAEGRARKVARAERHVLASAPTTAQPTTRAKPAPGAKATPKAGTATPRKAAAKGGRRRSG